MTAQTDNQQKFKVTGSVVNSVTGEPVRNALVELRSLEARTAMTGSDGRFDLDNVAGGSVAITARRPGFAAPTEVHMTFIGPSTDSIVVKLVPLAKISGQAVDKDGEPIEGLNVQTMHELIINGRKQWQQTAGALSDETGHFLIEDLQPGRYLVSTRQAALYMVPQQKSEPARYIYPTTFYPDANSQDMAQPIDLAAGGEMRVDLSIRVVRASQVSFTTVPRAQNVIGMITAGGNVAQTDASGVLTFGAVPPGSWKVIVRGPFSGPRQGNEEAMYGEVPVEVGSTDINDLKVALSRLPDIPILVAGAANSQLFVQLLPKQVEQTMNGAMNGGQGSDRTASGDLRIRAVTPGTYNVVVLPNGDGCVTSVTAGPEDLLRQELVVPPGGSVAPIQIQIAPGDQCARLTVTPNTKSTVMVVLTSDLAGFQPRVLPATEKGVTVPALSPGEYRVYALDDVTNLEYANADVMRDFKSQTVKLESGQKATVQVEVSERTRR